MIVLKDNINNANTLTSVYLHALPQRTSWRTIDELLGKNQPLVFRDDPIHRLDERSIPLGFYHDPNLLYFASNVGRDTFGIYGLNTKTWKRTDVAIDTPVADLVDPLSGARPANSLVFDDWARELVGIRYVGAERATLWLKPEFSAVQRTLRASLPDKTVEIIEWDRTRTRFLVLASSNSDPGTYYVFQRDENVLDEVMQRAPWLPNDAMNPSVSFGFKSPAGINLSGYFTMPKHSRLKLPPLIVLCHDGPWSRDQPGYNRDVQALASMGFAVLQVNFRGSTGFGRKHLNALRSGFDTVALDDVLASLDRIIAAGKVDRRFVAIMGTGYGGYLALRALQLHLNRFRCGVALEAPVDLPTWTNPLSKPLAEVRRGFLGGDSKKLREISPLSRPELFNSPLTLVQREGDLLTRGADLNRALGKLDREVTYLSLDQEELSDLPKARTALFLNVRDFLNTNIYNYAVKLGETVEKN